MSDLRGRTDGRRWRMVPCGVEGAIDIFITTATKEAEEEEGEG